MIKRYENYRDSGVEWIGEVPEHWQGNRIKEISYAISKGTTPSTEGFLFTDDGVRFIKAENIGYTKIVSKEPSFFISKEANASLSRSQLKKNDLLIVIAGATIGKVGIVAEDLLPANTNQAVCFIRFRKNNFDIELMYHLFSSDFFSKSIWYSIVQSAQPNLAMGVLGNLKLFIPPLPEQTAITNYLDTKTAAIDQKISLLEKKTESYRQLKQSLINETVTRGLDKKVKLKDSGVEWIGLVPEHWDVRRLKDIGKSIIGLTYAPENVVDDETEGLLVLRSSNIQNGKLSLKDTVYVKMAISRRCIVREGDILICSRNGSRALIGKNICIDAASAGFAFGAFMTVFRSKHSRFLSFFFNSNMFESQSGLFMSSTINQLTVNTLNSFIFALPPSSEQTAIAEYLDGKCSHIYSIIASIGSQIDKLKELRKTLINDVVTGKVKVV